ncbi:MAG: ribonuclease HI family protein [candidate division SR1 bacterium]|nr:ribonuclease HI family protein [candidate division SR1 bacterium]
MQNLKLFCDGGSRGNPGKAASGYVLFDHDKIIYEGGKYLGIATNNEAEWQAVTLGSAYVLDAFGPGIKLEVYLDSELVQKQITGVYRVRQSHLKPFFEEIKKIEKQFEIISFTHVYREKNKDADRVVNEILDKS